MMKNYKRKRENGKLRQICKQTMKNYERKWETKIKKENDEDL